MSADATLAILKTLSDIDQHEANKRKEFDQDSTTHFLRAYYWVTGAIVAPALIVGLLVYWFGGPTWLRWTVVGFYFLGTFMLAISPFIEGIARWRSIKYLYNHPLTIPLKNIKVRTVADLYYLPELSAYSIYDLENAFLEVQAEREYFEQRVRLLIGAIDKVGLFPGILALIVVLKDIADWNWVFIFALANTGLYPFGLWCHWLIMRLDRKSKLLALIITRKKSEQQSSRPQLPHVGAVPPLQPSAT